MRVFRYLSVLLIAVGMLAFAASSSAQVAVGISVRFGPPPLPVYTQPICPGPGYIWTPGYWAYGDDGYYWVPGTWVLAPRPGFLWTPGYWGWAGGVYVWHGGYWGPHVGFYGGINYGFGYGGVGFAGGYWRGGAFYYNRAVNNVNVTVIHNSYNKTVVVNNVHTSFNGGEHGVSARPTAEQERYSREEHLQPTHEQESNRDAASHNRAFFASENHGRPAVAATAHPGRFSGEGVEGARGSNNYHPAERGGNESARNGRPAVNHRANTERPNNGSRGQNSEHTVSKHQNNSHAEAKPESKPHSSGGHEQSKPEKHPHR
jgi:hypothetical protein